MGHMIHGFIGTPSTMDELVEPLGTPSYVAELPQDYRLLFLSDSLSEAIQQRMGTAFDAVEPLLHLSRAAVEYLGTLPLRDDFIYFETEYFGGTGTQYAAYFCRGKLEKLYTKQDLISEDSDSDRFREHPINMALRRLGVSRDPGLDEFDSLGLGGYRRMPSDEQE